MSASACSSEPGSWWGRASGCAIRQLCGDRDRRSQGLRAARPRRHDQGLPQLDTIPQNLEVVREDFGICIGVAQELCHRRLYRGTAVAAPRGGRHLFSRPTEAEPWDKLSESCWKQSRWQPGRTNAEQNCRLTAPLRSLRTRIVISGSTALVGTPNFCQPEFHSGWRLPPFYGTSKPPFILRPGADFKRHLAAAQMPRPQGDVLSCQGRPAGALAIARWLQLDPSQQLGVDSHDHRAGRHQHGSDGRGEDDAGPCENAGGERNRDDVVACRTPQALDHLAVAGAAERHDAGHDPRVRPDEQHEESGEAPF